MQTTLNRIREQALCQTGWVKLMKHLGKNKADDEPLNILTIINSNGLDDALRCLRAVIGCDREIKLYAVWCARQVQHLMTPQSVEALNVAERFVNGDASEAEMAKAAAEAAATTTWAAEAAAAEAWAAWTAGPEAWVAWTAGPARAAAAARTAAARVVEGVVATARDIAWVVKTAEMVRTAGTAAWATATRTAQETKLRALCARMTAAVRVD